MRGGVDHDDGVLGEVPPTAPGEQSFDEIRRSVSHSPSGVAQVDEWERQAREARLGVPGRFVAHYTSASSAFEHVLPDRQLRLSSFANMRDPRESKAWVQDATDGRSAYVSGRSFEDGFRALKAVAACADAGVPLRKIEWSDSGPCAVPVECPRL